MAISLNNLPVPGTAKLVTPAFFRAIVRALRLPSSTIRQLAVAIDPTATQLIEDDPTPATDTYHIKVALPSNIEIDLLTWVKNSQASIAHEGWFHFYTKSYGLGNFNVGQLLPFCMGIPDSYYLGGPTSVDLNFDLTTGKAIRGMRICRIDGAAADDFTIFTSPKTTNVTYPYLGRTEKYMTSDIVELSSPLMFTSANKEGTIVKSVVPVRYKGKIIESGVSSGTERSASYWDMCPAANATHFFVYNLSNPDDITVSLEPRV